MLEYLRNAADKPLAKFLMFVLIFSFVGWGVADWVFSGTNNETTLVNVGGNKISEQYFNVVHSEKMKDMAMKDREKAQSINKDVAARLQFKRSIMSDLIMDRLLLNRAEDLGYVISNNRIANLVNSDIMLMLSNQYRMKEFREDLRDDELRKMAGAVTTEALNVPEFMVDAAYNARYATRDIKYDTVKFNSFKIANPTDDALKDYYAQSPHIVPEARAVSYVLVEVDTSKPDEDEIGFERAKEIRIDSIMPDEGVTGDSMKVAAEKHHAKFVRLKPFKRGDKISDKVLTDELIDDIFAMTIDADEESSKYNSEIKQTKKGYVFLRVDEIIPEHNAEFKDVKKDLVSGWKKAEQRKKAYVQANDKLIGLNKNGSLKNAKTKSVTRTDGAPLAVLNAVFAGKPGDNTIVEDGDAFYVLHIDKNTAPKQDKKKKDSLRKELKNLTKGYVGDDYSQFLKREYRVKFNDSVYKKVIGQ